MVDECQHVAVRARGGSAQRSQRAKLAGLLARTSEALILTSATPHDGKKESFASLMNLLEPTAIADEQEYTAEDVAGLFVRRFKKDVKSQAQGSFRERALHPEHIVTTPEEDAVFELLQTANFRTIRPRRRRLPGEEGAPGDAPAGSGILFRTLLLKSFLSSPEALAETVTSRLAHPRLKEAAATDTDAQHDIELLTKIRNAADKVTPKKNSKLNRVVELLRQMGIAPGASDRAVLFSERIDTLELLERELPKALGLKSDQVAVFHGSLDDQEQQKLVKEFGSEKSRVRLLLASDAASEGVNLHHFCHRLVHYDIPWSLITLEQRNGRVDRFGQAHTPELYYLLTRPSSPETRGDLRVLDVLIEKEETAHKNLGDARWLLNLHDAEAEEERIAEGISNQEPPEAIIPDAEPGVDFLGELMSLWRDANSGGKQAAPAHDLTSSAALAPNATTVEPPQEPLRLFEHDLEFAQEAFQELLDNQPAELPQTDKLQGPDWEPQISGFVLKAPPDLRERYRFLPPELQQNADWTFKLTTDRERVQKALERSRQSADAWPEYELFWEQHPIAEWLNDRMSAHFRRHEAPVMLAHQGLEPGDCCFVFQGVLSNQHSQPMLAEWFVIRFDNSDQPHLEPLSELVPRVGLSEGLNNPNQPMDLSRAAALRPTAVAAAKQHMETQRNARRERLYPLLKDGQQRLNEWAKRKLQEIEARKAAATSDGKALRADVAQRLEARQSEIERQREQRKTWLTHTMSTVQTPYLRIAAVLLHHEAASVPPPAPAKKGKR